MLTFNTIVDTLAQRWSLHYRAAQFRGAKISYDMSEDTLKETWRELLAAGVQVPAIWTLLIRQTRMPTKSQEPPHPTLQAVYVVSRTSGKGHARGRSVDLLPGILLDDVRAAIAADAQYKRRTLRRLLLADARAEAPATRQEVCAERGSNVVKLNKRSRDVLAILEGSRVRFYVDRFREDCERNADLLRTHHRVYEQTAKLSLPRDDKGAGYVYIRSRFFRAHNRRFHAVDFWPEHIPGELRDRWFGVKNFQPEGGWYDPDPGNPNVEPEWVEPVTLPSVFVEQDISSSQTQVLAAFLGLDDLEELARRQNPKFKVYLAQKLWALHRRTRGGVLADGYTGPTDERLVEFVKEHWMRRNYGGKPGRPFST